MRKLIFSRLLSSCMVFGLLLSQSSLAAVAHLSKDAFAQKEDAFYYVYLGEDLSNLSRVIEQASALDEDKDSLLHAMKNYMNEGYLIAGYEEVLETLEYAQQVIEDSISRSNRDTAKNQLHEEITELIAQIVDGALCIDLDALERGCPPKDCCPSIETAECQSIVNGCRAVFINKDLQVCGNTLFKGKVKIKKDLSVRGDLKVSGDAVFKDDVTFKDPVLFEDNVTIEGTLSVTDLAVASCVDSLCVNTLSVTDLAVASCVDTLCVLNLSAVDAVIDNLIITSSILDANIVNLTVTGTASVTDLVVLSCMDTLCVNDLSVADISISGTLSVNDIIINDATVTNFSATDAVINTLTVPSLTPAGVVHNNASGLLSSSLIVNADVAAGAGIVDTKLATISTAGKVANSATTATSTNTPNTIVLRDGSGNFSAGTITAALNGNATTATTAVNFSGSLAGDVTGTQGATVVASVGGQIAANVAAATVLANGGTNLNTPNTLVKRDGTGSFAAQVVSMTDGVHTGNLVFTGATSTSTTGNVTKGGNRYIHNFGGNTFMGVNAGNFTLSAGGNVGIGVNALTALTSGSQNIAMGSGSLSATTTGTSNTAIGFRAMEANTTGQANTGLGQNTLLINTAGSNNVAVGAHTLEANTTANLNVAVGFNALNANNGDQNVAVGNNTLENITTGTNNTAIGKFAGQNAAGASSNNIYINNLGGAESGTIRIGNNIDQTTCFIAGIRGVTTVNNDAVAVLVDSAGQLGTVSSSAKVKHDIEDMGSSSDAVMQLRPVTFVYNNDQSETTQYGLIAEEVDQVFPAIVVHDNEGQAQTVQYHVLPILLLNEMKKQQLSINDLQSLVKSCLDRISALEINA